MNAYEVVDATDDECYWTAGIYSSLQLAVASLERSAPPQCGMSDPGSWDVVRFEVRRRPLDKYSEHGKVAAVVTWERLPIEDDDEEDRWSRSVEVKESDA
jgi:hypothetical protein